MNLQPIYNIAQICSLKGLTEAVLSPGSRNALLTLSLARHPEINCRTFSDERSAAFIALGMAQQTKKTTILACTSGSASLNYAPAVAEAYFQQIPLLVLTADRPPEWIDQLDGQTIRQTDIYGNHVKKSFQIPVDLSHADAEWHTYRLVSEAINLAQSFPPGPVHINIPFREPFYPENSTELTFSEEVKVIEEQSPEYTIRENDWEVIRQEWASYKKRLIVAGQNSRSTELNNVLQTLVNEQKTPIAGDIVSNLHDIEDVIGHADVFLGNSKKGIHESLQPDLLITFGKSTISKQLKLLLRKYKPTAHWHVQESGEVADTFQSLTKIVRCHPLQFFEKIKDLGLIEDFENQKQENYFHIWQIEERKVKRLINDFFPKDSLGEFEMINTVLSNLPESTNVHLANSMSVRYANYIGLTGTRNHLEVFANRGTSGIDGSNSTAVGSTLVSHKTNLLITGDLAFFYDRNAFWHNYKMPNLRILLLNNHAGGIFRMIKGPSEQPELEEYFETKQALTASSLAREFDFEYLNCDRRSKLKNYIKDFFKTSLKPKILELESGSIENKDILEEFKQAYIELN